MVLVKLKILKSSLVEHKILNLINKYFIEHHSFFPESRSE